MLIGITMGDASGIGPELILRAFREDSLEGDFIVIGDYKILDYCGRLLDIEIPFNRIEDVSEYRKGMLNIYDMGLMDESMLEIGQISKTSGYAAYRYVERATEMALHGIIHAIVTLPMNKEATRLSFPDFTGHTELIAQVCQQDNYTMMLASDRLVVTHVSTHVSMQKPSRRKEERILRVIELTHNALTPFIENPKIAVAGLNPMPERAAPLGGRDRRILPAVHSAQELGIDAVGPISPDTVFLKAVNKEYHAVVCMYHDQGHIPIKLLDFEGGVNVTLGLKVIRTSVDHGTAFDIAYKGIASPKSFVNAYNFARQMLGIG